MNYKNGFLFLLTIVLSGKNFSQGKWYAPVDIGYHVYIDSGLVKEEKLSSTEANKILAQDSSSYAEFYAKMNTLKDSWLKLYEDEYKKEFNSSHPAFHKKEGYPINIGIHEFSKSKVKIYVTFNYGYSRWHNYHVLLKYFLIDRSDIVDKPFSLKNLEKQYAYTFKGVGYGTSVGEMIKKLGNNYVEYIGQTPQYRNLYYEKYNLEIIIQNEIIKYIQKGKPDWMNSDMKRENKI